MKKNNKKGFTLVELLAVIVVLAIIMIIAMPNVLTAMNNAKKSAFKIYAQKVLNAAIETYQSDALLSDYSGVSVTSPPSGYTQYCYSLASMGMTSTGNYKGYVVVNITTNNSVYYHIYLTDQNYSVSGLNYDQVSETANINTTPLADANTTCTYYNSNKQSWSSTDVNQS